MKTSAKIIKFVLFVAVGGVGHLAFSSESDEVVCSKFDSPRKENCILAFKTISNKKALSYTVRYLQANSSGLKDPSCLRPGKDGAKKGIHNTCSFVLNDLTSRHKGSPLRANAYYVDLCAKSPKSVVKSFYVNKGTGTAHANYADRSGAHASNPGAYLTEDKIVNFVPYVLSSAYRGLKRFLGGFIPALRLTGLHSTNNDTAGSKPMHASPYRSSYGCPSVSADSVGVMRKLANNGPSLVMNYGPEQFHPEESLTKCNAIPEKARAKVGKSATRMRHGQVSVTYGAKRSEGSSGGKVPGAVQ